MRIMYRFYENFSVANEERFPYSMREEKIHSFVSTPSAFVEDGRLKLVRDHARMLLLTPALEAFDFSCRLGYVPPAHAHGDHVGWGIYFGYDERLRRGRILSVSYYEADSALHICLLNMNGNREQTEFTHIEQGVKLEGDHLYGFRLSVDGGKCRASFDGREVVFDCPSIKGRIGLMNRNSIMGLLVAEVKVEAEAVFAREVWRNQYVIPHYDGGSEDYVMEVVLRKYVEGPYEVSYELTGGAGSREPRDYRMRIWSVQYDVIKNPYLCFYGRPGSEKLYLYNGDLCFVEQNPTEKYTGLYMNGKSTPYAGRFLLEGLDEKADVAFGYEQFRRLGNELQEGEREFVYRDGQLIYSGRTLSEDYLIRIESPEDKGIVERIPKDIDEYEKALFQAKKNHYFLQGEAVAFRLFWHVKGHIPLLGFRAYLQDAFFEDLFEIELNTESADEFGEFGFSTYVSDVCLEKLEQGVYHIKACMLLGEKVICSHVSAFEVFDDSAISPRESSGIPFIYSGEAAPPNIKYNCPDPWMIKPDHNEIHYVECLLAMPEMTEYRKGWELMKLYKRKMFLWMNGRTIPEGKTCLDYPNSVKLADYIYASEVAYIILPGIFRNPSVRKIYEDFRRERPEYGLRKLPEEGITEEQFRELYRLCGSEWVDYVCEKNTDNIMRFHEEIRKLNPKVKFTSYGPYAIYGTNHTGILASKLRMVSLSRAHEVRDGFWFFEDYPFITGHTTSYSGWGMMGLLLHLPKARVVVELFGSFDPVCPDGYVCFAYPPMGGCFVETYRTVTQVYEHMYAAVYRNGKFCYYDNPGFQFLQSYTTEASKRFEEFLKGWGVYRKNKPAMPMKAPVFVMEYTNEEDRFLFEESRKNVNNISQAGQAYLYETVAQMGLPKGVSTDFEGFVQMPAEQMDVCVLPSLRNASEAVKQKVRHLSEAGIGLVAVGDIGDLTDLFGVEKEWCKVPICALERSEQSEFVACRNAEFFYRAKDAEVVLRAVTTDGENYPVILRQGKNILINSYICQVGVADFAFESFGVANVSSLLKKTVEDMMREISSPLAVAEGDCGINLFVTEQGEKRILLTDYSLCGSKEEKNILVQLYFDVDHVRFVGHKDDVIEPNMVKKEGKVKAFTVKLRPGESAMFAVES